MGEDPVKQMEEGSMRPRKSQSSRPKKTTITKTKTCIISSLLQLPQKNRSLEAQEHNTSAQGKKKKKKKKKKQKLTHWEEIKNTKKKINQQSRNTDLKVKNKKYHYLNSSKLSKSLLEKLYTFF
jgi:thiol:disulfide interchange protein